MADQNKPVTRVVLKIEEDLGFSIYSDVEIEFYVVNDHCPDDRVYLMSTVETGPHHVRSVLRDDPVGHRLDSTKLGEGYGPRKPPSRPALVAVDGGKKQEDD